MSTQTKNGSIRVRHMKHCALFAVLPAVVAVIIGCASASQIDTSVSTNRAAEEFWIAEVPKAAVHMQLAKEQMGLAEKMAANEQWDQAESMMKRAQADAQVARLLFQEEVERAAAIAAMNRRNQRRERREVQEENGDTSKERSLP
jgi:hypothetical protein